ncbi:hypothetical protein D3C74_457610 [compost metagenome]
MRPSIARLMTPSTNFPEVAAIVAAMIPMSVAKVAEPRAISKETRSAAAVRTHKSRPS